VRWRHPSRSRAPDPPDRTAAGQASCEKIVVGQQRALCTWRPHTGKPPKAQDDDNRYHMALDIGVKQEKGVDYVVRRHPPARHDVRRSYPNLPQWTRHLYPTTFQLCISHDIVRALWASLREKPSACGPCASRREASSRLGRRRGRAQPQRRPDGPVRTSTKLPRQRGHSASPAPFTPKRPCAQGK
jgi:hypothetical protein